MITKEKVQPGPAYRFQGKPLYFTYQPGGPGFCVWLDAAYKEEIEVKLIGTGEDRPRPVEVPASGIIGPHLSYFEYLGTAIHTNGGFELHAFTRKVT